MDRRQKVFLTAVAVSGIGIAVIGAGAALVVATFSMQECGTVHTESVCATREVRAPREPAAKASGNSAPARGADTAVSSSMQGKGERLPAFDPKKPVLLPPPNRTGGLPLMSALAARRSSRSFSSEPLDMRLLSDLFWAATGVNRPDSGERTAPTARDRRDLEVYAAFEEGLYRYDVDAHALVPILSEDIRAVTGVQPFVATASLNLIFTSDLSKIAGEDRETKFIAAGSHAGFVSQNVYLFSASAGLATVVRGGFDKQRLAEAMHLGPDQLIVLTQTVGYPESIDAER